MNDSEQRAAGPAPGPSATTSSSSVVGSPSIPVARSPIAGSSVHPPSRPPSGYPASPSTRPLSGPEADRAYRPWNVRRPNGTRAALPNNGELRAWIADGRITPDDELSPDGQHWTPLRSITNVDVFIAAAPPARTRRASSMAIPAVRLPTDDAVRAPTLGAVPAAPKVPSLAGLEDALDPATAAQVTATKRAVSIPPPAATPSVRVPPPAASKAAAPLSPLSVAARPTTATSSSPPAPATTAVAHSARSSASVAPPAKEPETTVPPPLPSASTSGPHTAAATTGAAASSVRLFAVDQSAAAVAAAVSALPADVVAAATSVDSPAIFQSDSIVPTPPSVSAPPVEPAAKPAPPKTDPPPPQRAIDKPSTTEPTPPARQRSMPPPPSISVDPTVYEEASKQHATVLRGEAPSWKINAALALALLGSALGATALARSFSARASTPAMNAPSITAANSDEQPMPSPATRAELDDRIESLSAEINASPSRSMLKLRRARLLSLRAEHVRGLADDLDALAATHSGEEATLDRAEARVLRRAATQDAQRASRDASAVRAEVPAANMRAEWMLSLAHAAVASDPTSRESTDYIASARGAGAQVRWIEALVARARGENPEPALEQAKTERDAPALAALTLARTARSAQHNDSARQQTESILRAHPDDEGALSISRTLGAPSSGAQSPHSDPAAQNTAAQSSAQEPAAAAPAEYLARVQAGRRALEHRMLPRARTEFRRALAVKSDGVEAQIGLAWVALRIGYYPVAAQSFRRLYAQGHNTPEVRVGLGLAHAKMREREPAVRYLRAYLGANPQGPLAQEARQALAQLGAG